MTKKTVTLLLLFLAVLTASAEDEKRNMFNPIHTALVSQTIAPDARGGGFGDVGAATDPDVVLTVLEPGEISVLHLKGRSFPELYSMVAPACGRYGHRLPCRLLPYR